MDTLGGFIFLMSVFYPKSLGYIAAKCVQGYRAEMQAYHQKNTPSDLDGVGRSDGR